MINKVKLMMFITYITHIVKRIHSIVLTVAMMIMLSSSLFPAAAYSHPSRNQDVLGAIAEMQKANYFTFVMLINMAPPDLFQGNFTFLMPNDRALSTAILPNSDVVNFLLCHSIPSTLLFEHLQHFPTGSFIPSSKPDLMLRVTNHGRRQFFLNNSRLISPNICTTGSSIRCHGIDGVLLPATSTMTGDHSGPPHVTIAPPPPYITPVGKALPPAAPSEPAPPVTSSNDPTPTPPPVTDSYEINNAQRWSFVSSMRERIIFGLMSFLVSMYVI
ncbi:unnamed protein product [Cuscuta europaea]|uniref:FAS1 domain-containing protein n=1 Tax=Cuscuta europaea TaxID=41803 RepID=A0A9P0ZRV6_CUSEU|nr:unnamed protein product [Cuscuta europaea]